MKRISFLFASFVINTLYLVKDEDEYKSEMSERSGIHGDIEYLYVVKDDGLYYVNEWDLREKLKTNQDLVDYVCKDSNKLDLSKRAYD